VSDKKTLRVQLEHKPDDEKKKYILRKRQEWESSKEIREFFYAPLEFPYNEDAND